MAKNLRKPLTEKAKAFCKEYVENGYNGRKAYTDAYQNPNEATAAIGSYQLLKDPRIQTEIAYMEGTYKSLSYKVGLTKELVVKTLVDMMNATKTIVSKSGEITIVPDWYARNQAISQYSKLTGDFNEKDKGEKLEERTIENVEEKDEGIVFSKLNTEDLELQKQKILARINGIDKQ